MKTFIAHYEAEKLSLTNMRGETWEHQTYKTEVMAQMDSKPSYESYLHMQQVLLDNHYETAKMTNTILEMQENMTPLSTISDNKSRNSLKTSILISNMLIYLVMFYCK
ncbi:unnamed protein product [Lactuca saligna]|uniref:Uncharacterized protein n=1 Tax=Lactuca saligna TaxID=75948 RepID=A0AA36E5P6_LACSI|nr:unnamed protein product [Lactuca saligna]